MRNIFFVCLLTLTCCTNEVDSFYTISHTEDIDVIPLIKPYRLIAPMPGGWYFEQQNQEGAKYGLIASICVSEINVVNRIIYGHRCMSLSEPNFYFVIIPDEGIEKDFDRKEDWDNYLKERKVNSDELNDVLTIYREFKNNYKSLPWYNQVKNK